MKPSDYRDKIEEKKLYQESTDDILTMIEILANARKGSPGTEDPVRFAASIICIILDFTKSPAYTKEAVDFRLTFTGISHSRELQQMFRQSFRPILLEAPSAEVAIQFGFSRLLARTATMDS